MNKAEYLLSWLSEECAEVVQVAEKAKRFGVDDDDEKDTKYFYRYTDVCYSNGVDEFDNPLCGHGIKLELSKYPVIKYTPKGAWINVYGDKKFVLLSARKRYACSSKEEAMTCFLYRKKRQLSILSSKVRDVEQAILMAEKCINSSLTAFM